MRLEILENFQKEVKDEAECKKYPSTNPNNNKHLSFESVWIITTIL